MNVFFFSTSSVWEVNDHVNGIASFSDTKTAYSSAHLGPSPGPVKVAEHVFSGVKTR